MVSATSRSSLFMEVPAIPTASLPRTGERCLALGLGRIRGPLAQCHVDGLALTVVNDRQRDLVPLRVAADQVRQVVLKRHAAAVHGDDHVAPRLDALVALEVDLVTA